MLQNSNNDENYDEPDYDESFVWSLHPDPAAHLHSWNYFYTSWVSDDDDVDGDLEDY